MKEVKKFLAVWKQLDLKDSTAHVLSMFDRYNSFSLSFSMLVVLISCGIVSMQSPMLAPSKPVVELTLYRLRISRIMLAMILAAIERAYVSMREVLSQRFFMAFSVLCMAMLSKFHSVLISVDQLLSLLSERLDTFLPFAASYDTMDPSLQALLTELEPLARRAPPLRKGGALNASSGSKPNTPLRTLGSPAVATASAAASLLSLDLGGAALYAIVLKGETRK